MNNHHLYVPQKRSPLNQVFRITKQRLILPHRRRKVAIIGASDGPPSTPHSMIRMLKCGV
jgi:hypothetical protein